MFLVIIIVKVVFLLSSVIFIAFGGIPFFLTNKYQNVDINPFVNSSSTSPCSNFYEYACVKWQAETVKPDFELSWNHFTAASYRIKTKIQRILESPSVEDKKYPLLHNAQTFYNACIHFEERKDQYLTDLRALINHFGGWPILDQNYWIANKDHNWLEEIASVTRNLGFHPIVKFHVGIDYKNTEKYVFYIEPGNLIFPSNILRNPLRFSEELAAYERWISQSIRYLFPGETATTNITGDVRKIVDFETKLAKLMAVKPGITERNTLEHFSKRFNTRRLLQVFEILFAKMNRTSVKSSDIIVIKNYGYFRNLLVFMRRNNGRRDFGLPCASPLLKSTSRHWCIVGYSEWMTNLTALSQYYSELSTITEDHLKNLLLVKQLKMRRNFLLQGTTVASPQCPSNIFDVNAYYSILQNLIFVPLGIIQEPFYHERGPRIFNYGALGSLIGHEFSHSLDTTGRQANSEGKIEKWWPNEDISGYQLRSKCFETNKNQPQNVLSTGENIADNVGLDVSYRAYKKQDNTELSGDIFWDVRNEKIFFLSYAQMWCEISDPLDLFSDEHTSAEVRVNQAVSNNHHFNEIFDCNEENICKLW